MSELHCAEGNTAGVLLRIEGVGSIPWEGYTSGEDEEKTVRNEQMRGGERRGVEKIWMVFILSLGRTLIHHGSQVLVATSAIIPGSRVG